VFYFTCDDVTRVTTSETGIKQATHGCEARSAGLQMPIHAQFCRRRFGRVK